MGVHFLQTFMEEKVPGGYKKVNIAEIAKAKNGSRSNVLVIDLSAMACKPFGMCNMREVVKKDINGGDFARYKDAWIKILDRFEKAGIKAIFVCDGGLPDSRRKVWIKRRYGKMKSDIIPMLNSIRQRELNRWSQFSEQKLIFFFKREFFLNPFCKKKLEIINMIQKKIWGG